METINSARPQTDNISCNICGRNSSRLLYAKHNLEIVKCRYCHLVYTNPRLQEEDLLKRYNPEYFFNEYLPGLGASEKTYNNAFVRQGKFEDIQYPSESFDVVTIQDKIEHMPDPYQTISKIKRILKKNGILFISTPDLNSLSRLFLGKNWAVLSPAEHLFYFTEKTLHDIISKAARQEPSEPGTRNKPKSNNLIISK